MTPDRYISADSLKGSNNSEESWSAKSSLKLSTGSKTIERESSESDIAEVSESGKVYYLYRAAKKNASFSGSVVRQATGTKGFSFGSALGNIGIVVANLKNNQEEYQLKTNADGSFTITNAIKGDQYTITPQVQGSDPVTVQVLEDGSDVGIVTVANVDYNFKITARPLDNPCLFADGTSQNVEITVTNCGKKLSVAPTYTLSSIDPRLTINGTLENNLKSLEPGKSQIITVPITVGSVVGEYEDLAISIKLEIYNGPTWEDRVSLRFYKDDKLPIHVKSDSWNASFACLIWPDGRVNSFSNKNTLYVPWKNDGYKVVMSGASASTEVKYALWAGEAEFKPNLGNQLISPGSYEPNDSLSKAAAVYIRDTEPILSYLHVEDIDWFDIKYSESKIGVIASTAAGNSHSLVLKEDGTLLAMGWNYYGQLGNGTTSNQTTPIKIMTDVAYIAAGANHSLILKSDGSLWATGENSYGQLGDGSTIQRTTPVNIMNGVIAMAAGGSHSLILKENGSLYATGYNSYFQLGDGSTTDRLLPVEIMSGVKDIAAGSVHSLILKQDGTLWSVGNNTYGQLGDGTNTSQSLPKKVAENVKAVAVGAYHSLFIKNDNSLWGMGKNSKGQLGNGTTTNSVIPIKIMDDIVTIKAGSDYSLFIKESGILMAMGDNSYGQLGDGTLTDRSQPVEITNNVKSVSAGSTHGLVLKNDGSLWGMGYNSSGQLGEMRSDAYPSHKPIYIM